MTPISLERQRFGRLTVIRRSVVMGHSRMWDCICDCGASCSVRADHLKTGATKSCGCLNSEMIARRKFKHGATRSPEWKSWMKMRGRCLDPRNNQFQNYGARGIKICERWNEFKNFLSDLGARPSRKHSLDRINNDGNYEPSNCRWADAITQGSNKRNNARLEFGGLSLTKPQWERKLGLPKQILTTRLRRGWSVEKALFTDPIQAGGRS